MPEWKSDGGRGRQPSLFRVENTLTQRFGQEYFAGLPAAPGVYYFFDETGRLLYIGQSASLRSRVGSYRHVSTDRHPRRTVRLVARIRRIEWEVCASPNAAIERERALLLEHRPPFNRAGVWAGPPWWVTAETFPGMLVLRLGREDDGIGPLPPSFRYVFGTMARCVYRALRPELHFHSYPHGLMKPSVPLRLSLPLTDVERAWQLFAECASGETENLMRLLEALAAPTSIQQQEFWAGERDQLLKYGGKPANRITDRQSVLPVTQRE